MKITLVAGLTLLTTDALFAQSADQNGVDALKTQMNQMQRQYEQRIEAMEAKMKVLESNANSGSILNTRVLTDADGKEMPGKAGPMLDESFLKSLTRNFTFNLYLRAGVAFNGSGGAQGKTSFVVPDNYGGRFRLGNENDFFTELSFNQAHILGDSPDVMDVSVRLTLEAFSGIVKESAVTTGTNGGTSGFGIGFEEAFVEAKNVFKSAPEITFWAGQRFYDRWNIDPNDYFWLNTSGFGIGVYNIQAGPGKIYLAWIGSNLDNLNEGSGISAFNNTDHVGNLYKQTLDLRYKDIDIGFGKLTLVAIGNYIKGDTFETSQTIVVPDGANPGFFTTANSGPAIVKTQDMWGGGGGAIWQFDFGNKSYFRLAGLFGYGATNFFGDIDQQLNAVNGAFADQLSRLATGHGNNVQFRGNGEPFVQVNPVTHSSVIRAIAEFIWNPNPCFSMDLWGVYENSNQGFQQLGIDGNGNLRVASGTRNIYGVGFRPVIWIADNFAIQGQAGFNYIDNVRNTSGTESFSRSGELGVFTIAPTIKPKGGYSTRPEIRLFATYAVWSNSLKGSSASGGVPPYNGNTNQGWLIGSQAEIWF